MVKKGSYILLIELNQPQRIRIGKKRSYDFSQGFYVYVGSALNGIEQRIQRHLRKEKKIHWHIDYLLQHAHILDIYYKKSELREECTIAQSFHQQVSSIADFGCSDCSCTSHLFHGSKEQLLEIINNLDLKKANL